MAATRETIENMRDYVAGKFEDLLADPAHVSEDDLAELLTLIDNIVENQSDRRSEDEDKPGFSDPTLGRQL